MFDNNLFGEFDTTGVEKMGGYEVYPPGDYPAIMISASRKLTRDQSGEFVECVYQFIEGAHSGKRFTSRMNLKNNSQQTVDIAKRELKSLRAALGLPDNSGDLNLFINKPLVLRLNAKPRKDQPGVVENNLTGIEAYGSQVAAPAPQYQQQQPTPVAPQFAAPQPQQPQQTQPQPTQWAQHLMQQPAPTFQQAPAFTPNGQTPPWGAR